MIRDRDKAILSDLDRFRAMTREHISKLHFTNVKNPTKETNTVLLRLKRESLVSVSKERRIYTYFPAKSIKKDSSKLNHYLSIVDFYCELIKYGIPYRFEVEYKLGNKGYPEPDILLIWCNTVFLVEIQRSDYSQKQWQDKINRYEQYYQSDEWKKLDFQKEVPKFPVVWVVGKGQGFIRGGQSFKCLHTTVEEMADKLKR